MDTDGPKAQATLAVSPHVRPSREAVCDRYKELLIAQEDVPDKIFIGGYALKELDPSLIVLLEEPGTEHPRMWTLKKKIWATAYVAAFAFISPFASKSL